MDFHRSAAFAGRGRQAFAAGGIPLWDRPKAHPTESPRKRMAVAKKTQAASEKAAIAEFAKEQELASYRDMLNIRRFEEKAGQMYGMGLIGGFCHLYIGQEAVVVGMQMALKKGDQVITGYRDHGHMLA